MERNAGTPDGAGHDDWTASGDPLKGAAEGFVDRTLARIDADPDVRLSRLLAAYRTPEPSADFVERTMAAWREQRPEPAAALRRPMLAAAALLLAAAGIWWLVRGDDTPLRPGTAVEPSLAAAFGRHAAGRPRADAPPAEGFFAAVDFAAGDGLALLTGGGR